jgi:hypothetical protein
VDNNGKTPAIINLFGLNIKLIREKGFFCKLNKNIGTKETRGSMFNLSSFSNIKLIRERGVLIYKLNKNNPFHLCSIVASQNRHPSALVFP